jgi:hypothetical protein
MEARMTNTAMVPPGTMPAIQARLQAAHAGGVPPTTLELVHLRAAPARPARPTSGWPWWPPAAGVSLPGVGFVGHHLDIVTGLTRVTTQQLRSSRRRGGSRA